MTQEPFDVQQWSDGATADQRPANVPAGEHIPARQKEEVEGLIAQIEAQQIDIAPAYRDWCNLGFAFVDSFGEAGREYYQRVSRFYPGYTEAETNKQYDHCLKSNRGGVTLKTFFWLARNAGIGTAPDPEEMEEQENFMPTFPFWRNSPFSPFSPFSPLSQKGNFPQKTDFPVFLQKVMEIAESDEERDLLLLGTITVLSACLGKVSGVYDRRRVFPNLFLFITARASAGKGLMMLCKKLVLKVHRSLRQESERLQESYQQELTEYNSQKGKNTPERPRKPSELMLLIPANNSTTGFFQLLADNDGKGLVMETEGDTLSLTFKTDYGNYSDGFRKAFHHEPISYYRRTDREYVEINNPRLSAILSGTPTQVASLIHSSENGLFSRFAFYYLNVNQPWRDVFDTKDKAELEAYFESLGEEVFQLFQSLQAAQDIRFRLSPDQEQRFNAFFKDLQEKYLFLLGLDFLATIRRLGLIFFRICMVLTALRISEKGHPGTKMECDERDFEIARTMIRVLIRHSARVFSELPEEAKPIPRKNLKEEFLEALPLEFNRQIFVEVAQKLGIQPRRADKYVRFFLDKSFVHRQQRDTYLKILP